MTASWATDGSHTTRPVCLFPHYSLHNTWFPQKQKFDYKHVDFFAWYGWLIVWWMSMGGDGVDFAHW
jgi:hypothetical protein